MIVSKKFRNKKTGEIVTQVPLLDINDYEEVVERNGIKYLVVEETDKKRKLKRMV